MNFSKTYHSHLFIQLLHVGVQLRIRHLPQSLLDPLHNVRPRVAATVIRISPGRLADVVDDEIGHDLIERGDAVVHLRRLRQRPEPGARETERQRSEDHGLASVGPHVRRVATQPRLLVNRDEMFGQVVEDVEHGLDGLLADGCYAFENVRRHLKSV